jgi:hypothetical protein
MKNTFKTIALLLMSGLFACTNAQTVSPGADTTGVVNVETPADSTATASSIKKIKLAILLDTSGSMDGLIEQAKNQLWKIVNQLAKAKDSDGRDPEIEIALYQYGNDGISAMDGYVQQIYGFTGELDEISERLFALKTNGGSEYCGTVIKKSIKELEWSDSREDLQLIFIAGNEAFTQGSVHYKTACNLANNKNVIVNTIFCGEYHRGVQLNWQHGARITSGKYMNINSDAQIVHIKSPYDIQINQLNIQLNNTYIAYGRQAAVKKSKQIKEDSNAASYGTANMTTRILSKGGKAYKNSSWDMVDAAESESFEVAKVEGAQLPEVMKDMNTEEKTAYIAVKKSERTAIQNQIKALGKKREVFVKAERKKMNVETQLDDVIISAIIKQAEGKKYTFE